MSARPRTAEKAQEKPAGPKDALDIPEDPEETKANLKAFKKTLEVHYDPTAGIEKNEEHFQETMLRFCKEYMAPEVRNIQNKPFRVEVEALSRSSSHCISPVRGGA